MSIDKIVKNLFPIIFLLYLLELRELLAKSLELQCDECRYNSKHFDFFNLTIANNTVFAEVATKTKISYGFKFYIDIELRLQKSKKYNSVFKTHVDICRVLMSIRKSAYKKWMNSVVKFGNFSDKCPTQPGNYYIKGWKLEDDLIPGFMFSGDYRIKLHGYYGRLEKPDEDMFVDCVFIVKLN